MSDRRDRPPDEAEAWRENRERKLTLGLDATPAQRLAWLEEAIALAFQSGALPKPRSQ